MANWDDIRTGVARAANTTIKKTGELAENASMHVKLARLMSKRDEMFEKLGKLTYTQLKSDESRAEEIAAVIAQIDSLGTQIVKQKAKIEKAKAEKAQAKAQKADTLSEEQCASEVKAIIDENSDK